ncbi:hypothetical protein P7C70_g4868, partial [Phenoliferia sp. Uapishka_3]
MCKANEPLLFTQRQPTDSEILQWLSIPKSARKSDLDQIPGTNDLGSEVGELVRPFPASPEEPAKTNFHKIPTQIYSKASGLKAVRDTLALSSHSARNDYISQLLALIIPQDYIEVFSALSKLLQSYDHPSILARLDPTVRNAFELQALVFVTMILDYSISEDLVNLSLERLVNTVGGNREAEGMVNFFRGWQVTFEELRERGGGSLGFYGK